MAESLAVLEKFPRAVYAMIERGQWHYEQYPENTQLTGGYFGALKASLPQEIRQLFAQKGGWQVLHCGGLGSLANLCGQETIERVLGDKTLLEEFLTLCELFDNEIPVDGPGTRQRAGLIAVTERAT